MITVSKQVHDKGAICRSILSALPEWFGISAAVEAYVAGVESLPMLVARAGDTGIVGFLSLKFHGEAAAEAYVLGVRPEWHRQRIGSKLFEAAEGMARSRGCTYLTVKTLAASQPDPGYKATRLFYESIGFVPIEVLPELWGPEDPCLLMLKRLK